MEKQAAIRKQIEIIKERVRLQQAKLKQKDDPVVKSETGAAMDLNAADNSSEELMIIETSGPGKDGAPGALKSVKNVTALSIKDKIAA